MSEKSRPSELAMMAAKHILSDLKEGCGWYTQPDQAESIARIIHAHLPRAHTPSLGVVEGEAGEYGEPWELEAEFIGDDKPTGNYQVYGLIDPQDDEPGNIGTFYFKAHGKRAIACVDACRGLTDPAASIALLKKDYAKAAQLSNEVAALRRERDELRAALYEITRCDISDGGWGGPRALKIAREALAATNRAALSPSPVSTPTAEAEQTYVPPRGVTLPEGYEWAGEFRYPRKGEWFIDPDDHGPSEAQFDFRAGKHHIVRVKAEQAGGE